MPHWIFKFYILMKRLKNVLTLAAATMFATACCASGKIVSATSDASAYSQYEMSEWTITLKADWTTHPYNQEEVKLDMHFIDGSGQESVLPCYYVKGESGKKSVWKARFAPRSLGENQISFVLEQNGEVVSELPVKPISVEAPKTHGILHANDNWTFKYDDGTLFRGVGENICWECRDEDDSKFFKELHEDATRFNYDYMLNKLADLGGNFFRMWMIYWNMPVDWKVPENNSRYTASKGEFNESGLERMDHVVALCDERDVHMMLALGSHAGLLGHGWDICRYNVANGGPAETPTDFFANPEARKMYKDYLRLLIARYGYSPAIACWEFFNEVDNAMYNSGVRIPDDIVADWHKEMAEYIKATDPYDHMVTTSVSHRDVRGMNSIDAMDFNQKHIYCNTPAIPGTINRYEAQFGKPYVIGEQGYHWDWSLNFNDYLAEFEHDYRVALWLGLFSPTPILPMSWWWEFFEEHKTVEYLTIVRKMNDMIIAAGDGDFSSADCTTGLKATALAVKAGEQTFVYLHNDKDKADDVKATVDVADGDYEISVFNTTTGEIASAAKATAKRGKINLPSAKLAAKGDVIYILQK